ncbi:MAG: hypothetical protein ACI841_005053 [Planctomycetota bacterium]|jgi:hypothetical protein
MKFPKFSIIFAAFTLLFVTGYWIGGSSDAANEILAVSNAINLVSLNNDIAQRITHI